QAVLNCKHFLVDFWKLPETGGFSKTTDCTGLGAEPCHIFVTKVIIRKSRGSSFATYHERERRKMPEILTRKSAATRRSDRLNSSTITRQGCTRSFSVPKRGCEWRRSCTGRNHSLSCG